MSLVTFLAGAVVACGGPEGDPAPGGAVADEADVGAATTSALCSSVTRQLVCGKDGRTYSNICRAGGLSRVAHTGACRGFVCNGVACVAGFTCRTATNFGVPVDQCVSDTGAPPACSCEAEQTCVVEQSGATRCETPEPPPPARAAATLCTGKICPTGTHCEVTTINFGVPAPTCMYD